MRGTRASSVARLASARAPLMSALVLVSSVGSSGCTPQALLELPAVPGVRAWVVVASSDDATILRARVVSPDQAYRLVLPEEPAVLLEALAFDRELGVAPGELAILDQGASLPAPAATFAADLLDPGHPAWRPSTPSERALGLRIPESEACPRYDATLERISEDDEEGVRAMVRLGPSEQVVITRDRWLLVTPDRTRELPILVPNVLAAARADAGTVLVANDEAVWAVYGDDPFTSTASRTYAITPGFVTFSIASPQPGRVYGLTTRGKLFYTDGSTVAVVHQFESPDDTFRGMVAEDGTGVLAVYGEDPTFVRVSLDGSVSRLTLPERGENPSSIARFGNLGIVVGTTAGNLRAERLEFQPIDDPGNTIPSGIDIRALAAWDERLYFGGGAGLFGTVDARGVVCTSPAQAGATVRFVGELGRGVLASGRPLRTASSEVYVTRFFVRE